MDCFLEALAEQGAFVGTSPDESHFVIGDERVNRPSLVAEGKFNLLFGFATSKPGEFDTWLVTHQGRREPRAAGVGKSRDDLETPGRMGDRDLDIARLGFARVTDG